MKLKSVSALIFLLPALILAQAQYYRADSNTLFMLREARAMVSEKDNRVFVQSLLPKMGMAEGEDELDIQKDDLILMINAKRIKSVQELQEIYETAEPESEIKLGIQRGEQMLITKFTKADPSKTKGIKMMVMSSGDNDASGSVPDGAQVMRFDDSDGEIRALMELGMILGEDDGVIIKGVLPMIADIFGDKAPGKGDKIVSVNGKAVTKLKEFNTAYDAIEVGSEVVMDIKQGSVADRFKISKPQAPQMMMNR